MKSTQVTICDAIITELTNGKLEIKLIINNNQKNDFLLQSGKQPKKLFKCINVEVKE